MSNHLVKLWVAIMSENGLIVVDDTKNYNKHSSMGALMKKVMGTTKPINIEKVGNGSVLNRNVLKHENMSARITGRSIPRAENAVPQGIHMT